MRQAMAFATVDGRATLALRPLGRRANLPLASLWLAREFDPSEAQAAPTFSGDKSIQK
jgi:hypothetical protein